jgi:predicted DNA-binding ribbon-helix-helix protein
MTIKKKLHSFKFHDKDFEVWQKLAQRKGVPLTTLIERVMNKHHNDKNLFI